MAREVYAFNCTIPPGTLATAPITLSLATPPRRINELEFLVPPGPRGEVGFAVGVAGQPIFPQQPGAFLVTDDERLTWPLEDAIDSGAWEFYGYNTGSFPHTIYVRLLVDLTTDALPVQSITALPIDIISQAPTLPVAFPPPPLPTPPEITPVTLPELPPTPPSPEIPPPPPPPDIPPPPPPPAEINPCAYVAAVVDPEHFQCRPGLVWTGRECRPPGQPDTGCGLDPDTFNCIAPYVWNGTDCVLPR